MERVDDQTFRDAMSHWPSGVAVVTAVGSTSAKSAMVTSLSSASMHPPLIQVGLCHESRTAAALVADDCHEVVVSMLGELEGADPSDVVDSVERTATTGGSDHAHVTTELRCDLHAVLPAGDHLIFLLLVRDVSSGHDLRPAVYHERRFTGLGCSDASAADALGSARATGGHHVAR